MSFLKQLRLIFVSHYTAKIHKNYRSMAKISGIYKMVINPPVIELLLTKGIVLDKSTLIIVWM